MDGGGAQGEQGDQGDQGDEKSEIMLPSIESLRDHMASCGGDHTVEKARHVGTQNNITCT